MQKKRVDKAAVNYMTFLCEGRSVILEDTAILQDMYPTHRLFKLPCFQMPAAGHQGTELQQKWKAYKEAVLAAHGRTVDDHLTVCNLLHLVCCSIIDHCLVQLHKQHLHPVRYAASALSVHSTGVKLSAFCLACRGSRQGLTWLPRMPCWSCKMLT